MKIILVADRHSDTRRDLIAFRPPSDFPVVAEAKVLVAKLDGIRLGNHSHPHVEGFMLAAGKCHIRTWSQAEGLRDHDLTAPTLFMFEPDEEHVVIGSENMVLVGYLPVTFEQEHNVSATHLD